MKSIGKINYFDDAVFQKTEIPEHQSEVKELTHYEYINSLIEKYFEKKDWETAKSVAWCESYWENIQSYVVKNGIREESYGIFQINLPAHPEIKKEQALDIEWNIKWSAAQFKKGNQKKWSCYKHLFL